MKSVYGITAAFLIIATGIAGCEQRIQPSVLEGIAHGELPDQESWDSTIIISRAGVISAIIEAGYIAVYSEQERTLLDAGVHIDFYDTAGTITSVMVSDRGIVYEDTQNLSGYGNVVIEGNDGTVLETEEIHWAHSSERIHTNEFVTITSPDEIIQGYGLESDAGLSNYTIYRVTGQTRPGPPGEQGTR
jgi:LPS export ABC transporter protein LptC